MKYVIALHIFLLLITLMILSIDALAEPERILYADKIDVSEFMNLPALIQISYDRNPKIRAARTEWQAAIEKFPQITSLPDPMFMYGYYLRSIETRVGPQRHKFSISQSFPYPGTLDAAGEVSRKMIEIQEKKYEQAVRDIIVGIKLSYYELAYLEQAIQITTQNKELLSHIIKIAETRYAENKATFNDLMKAQSQQAQLSYDLILLLELQEVEKANLRALLDLPVDTPLGSSAPLQYEILDVPLNEIYQRGLVQRQELQISDLMAQKAEKAIKLAKMKNKPMFKLDLMTVETGGALMPDAKDSGKNPWTIGLGISIPLWRAKNKSRVREAELNKQLALENKEWMEAKLLAGMRKIYFRLKNSRRLVELYENSLIPQAKKAIEISETWHQEGEPKSVAGLLETQSVWLNFNLARARAIADYMQNLARMEQLAGGSLAAGNKNVEQEAVGDEKNEDS